MLNFDLYKQAKIQFVSDVISFGGNKSVKLDLNMFKCVQ